MSGSRLVYLDRLRVFLTFLVIAHHTAIAYGGEGGWYFVDNVSDELTATKAILTLFTGVNQAFFMGFFFLIAGYFTPGSYDRKGAGVFMKDRLIRLGLPLLAYLALVGPALIYALEGGAYASFADFYSEQVLTLKLLNFGPLWFVEALLYMGILYALVRMIAASRGKPEREREQERSFPRHGVVLRSILLVGLAAFAIRLLYPTGENVLGMQFGYFVSYVFLFVVGILAYRNRWFDKLDGRIARRWVWTAIAAIPVLPVAILTYEGVGWGLADDLNGGLNVLAFAYAMWEPFVGFGIILGLIVWFRGRRNRESRVGRMLANSAFTAYIIHAPVVVAFTFAMQEASLPPLVKFVAVSVLATGASFALGWLIRALPGMKRVL